MTDMESSDLERRRQMFSERVTQHAAAITGYQAAWQRWRGRLLQVGGVEVVPPFDPEVGLDVFVRNATVQPGSGAIMVKGKRNGCHENTEALVRAGRTRCGKAIVAGWAGYALSDDGLWRQHSWATTTGGVIVETTEARILYAGVQIPGASNQ